MSGRTQASKCGAYLYRSQDGRDIVDRAPLVLQDVQANAAIIVDCPAQKVIMGFASHTAAAQTSKQGYGSSLFGWNICDLNLTTGALFGYSSVKTRVSLKVPASHTCTIEELDSFPRL